MKLKIISIAALVMLIVAIPLVYGAVDWTLPYNNLSSGYRVTTENFPNPVMIGDPVVAWAGTTNASINEVKFRWNPPEGSGLDPIVAIGTYEGFVDLPDGTRVYQWKNTQYPNAVGDWGVQAEFYALDESGQGTGHGVGPIPDQPLKTAIRARSFFAIPEVAIGTIATLIAMFGALWIFAARKRRVQLTRKSL